MKTNEEVFQLIKTQFPDLVLEFVNVPFEPLIKIAPKDIKDVSLYLRDAEGLLFDSLMCLSGVDDANGEKIPDADGTVVIKGGTLSVYYHLESTKIRHKLTLKVSVPRENPETVSVESVWKSADWHEREAYDMFGIIFNEHPNLIRILMPYDWDAGYPLRKDYKNPEFYQGMKIPY